MSTDDDEEASSPSDSSKKNKRAGEYIPDASSIRKNLGDGMHEVTEVVNNNIIAARYGTVATIALLTAYGLSNTPLFFRFRTVADIPESMFSKRRKLYGRVVGVVPTDQGGNGIQLLVRHLSPVGQILPKSWFDFLIKLNPRQKVAISPSVSNDALKVQLAGVEYPPVSRLNYQPEQWLESLVRDRTLVGMHLVARKVPQASYVSTSSTLSTMMKENPSSEEVMRYQIALCRITYRPTILQLFATDVAEALVRSGNASASSSMFADSMAYGNEDGQEIHFKNLDASQRLQDLRKDTKYLDRLAKAEFEAVRESNGMWSVPEIRATKQEVVDEVEFQSSANFLQKLWRKLRRG